jgi:delta14-sterol reductase
MGGRGTMGKQVNEKQRAAPTPQSTHALLSSSSMALDADKTPNLAVAKGDASVLNPRSKHYEFMGPPGALFVSTAVPFFAYALYFACSEHAGGCPPRNYDVLLPRFIEAVSDVEWWKGLWDTKASLIYAGWYAFCVLAAAVLPGDTVDAPALRTGERLQYKMNGISLSLLLCIACSRCASKRDAVARGRHRWRCHLPLRRVQLHRLLRPLGWLRHRLAPHGVHAGVLRVRRVLPLRQAPCPRRQHRQRALRRACCATMKEGGADGTQWFIGRELNPTFLGLDLKSFNELRPGLILWALIDISMACEQALRLGGRITDSMALVLLFHGAYVADACFNEPAILTTMDITTDGFGFMLAVGDLCWVPFTYSLQARSLAFHPVDLGPVKTAAILAVNALGYYIFRTANSEKNDFRNGRNPKSMCPSLCPSTPLLTATQTSSTCRPSAGLSSLPLVGGAFPATRTTCMFSPPPAYTPRR